MHYLLSHSKPPGVFLQYSFGSVQRLEPSFPLHSSISGKQDTQVLKNTTLNDRGTEQKGANAVLPKGCKT